MIRIDQLKYRVHSGIYIKEANHAGEDVGKYLFFLLLLCFL